MPPTELVLVHEQYQVGVPRLFEHYFRVPTRIFDGIQWSTPTQPSGLTITQQQDLINMDGNKRWSTEVHMGYENLSLYDVCVNPLDLTVVPLTKATLWS